MRATPGGHRKGPQFAGFSPEVNSLRFPEMGFAPRGGIRFDARLLVVEIERVGVEDGMANGRTHAAKESCENCFFGQNLLCAVAESGPCGTFRPAHPDGLRPPSQLRFVFRQERRLQVAWAFPSPNEQVALHA
jgi:hypothetical protein